MQQISFHDLLERARAYNAQQTPWHHHYLPPRCAFNQTISYRISLENEETGEVVYAEFETPPTEALKRLEALFFQNHE